MASGDTLDRFEAPFGAYPSGSYATPDWRNEAYPHGVYDFDDTDNESIIFRSIMAQNYGNGGVTAYLHYSMETATSGDIDWDVAFERIGDQQQDVDTASFATAQSVDNTTVPATAGLVDIVSIAFTDGAQMDSVTSGELYRILVTRDAASDTASGDAELHAVEIRET